MNCCTPENSTKIELKDTVCPFCQKKGHIVKRETPDSLLKAEHSAKVTEPYYMFCQTPDCEVVYYSQTPEHKFLKADLKVPVTIKDSGLGVPVCYCFNVTRESVLNDFREIGHTKVFESISQKVKDGLCSCETMNPQGNCCLGNVKNWIKEACIQGFSSETALKKVP